ncbi:YegP family protein [Rhizobium oryzicola]|uniref:DUF1508 domain-containing protein n=1 Tax=Rhizobium oryzicola TaxID=1232668 RepID=A0ABT8SQB8_9HYPH|nr:DUF1508 domain-containing protein [Rhizobium oryzicola]MDO1580667.1 DUF1508 domain-containing protein [Rhizobium oryzicola]
MYRFEIYEDRRGEFRFRYRAPNGEIMFISEGYTQKESAVAAVEAIKRTASGAATIDQTIATA